MRFVAELLGGLDSYRRGRSPKGKEEENPFGDPSGSLLRIDAELERKPRKPRRASKPAKAGKRKRPPPRPEPRDKILGISTLHDLVRRAEELEVEFEASKELVRSIPDAHFRDDPGALEELVGDELRDA